MAAVKKKKDELAYVQEAAQAAAAEVSCRVMEVAFEKEPTGLYLRVYIDTDKGVTLNECERVHRLIQPKLEDVNYDFLEVSSPGIDRPIRNAQDAQRVLGQEVELRLYRPRDRRKVFTGILAAFDGQTYTITTPQGEMTFPNKEVAVARRTVDLSEAIQLEGSDRTAPSQGTKQEER